MKSATAAAARARSADLIDRYGPLLIAFNVWRSAVWRAALAMLAAVQAGGAIPESPIAGLPEMEWPE